MTRLKATAVARLQSYLESCRWYGATRITALYQATKVQLAPRNIVFKAVNQTETYANGSMEIQGANHEFRACCLLTFGLSHHDALLN